MSGERRAKLEAVEVAAAELKVARGNRQPFFTGTKDEAHRISQARWKRDEAVRTAREDGATIDQLATAAGIVGKAVKRITGERQR